MITSQEFDRIAKLALLQISDNEKDSFLHKMEHVIDLIDPLRTLDIDQMRYDLSIPSFDSKHPVSFVSSDNVKAQMQRDIFFSNISHQCINDSIVIKSSLVQSDS